MNKSQVSSPDRKRALREASGRLGSLFEELENRVLLSGDHPSFADFPSATAVALTSGAGSVAGIIETADTDDLFSFTVSSTDFVTILADALNEGGALDTRIELYRDNPMFPGSAIAVLGPDGNVLAASGNGTLTGGTPTDGWIGAVLSPNTYYVRVLGEGSTTGDYTLRVDTTSTAFDLLDADGNSDTESGAIALAGSDIVYRVDTSTSPGGDVELDGLATATTVPGGAFDSRVELYDSAGRLIKSDSQSGFGSNSYLAWRSAPDTVFYLRVRGDDLSGTSSTGAFTLDVDTQATPVETAFGERGLLDPVSRMGYIQSSGNGTGKTSLFTFTAQSSGVAYVNVQPLGLFRESDPAVRLYGPNGSLIGFNDTFSGDTQLQIAATLVGGSQYFVVVDSFSPDANGLAYHMLIEANHTLNVGQGIDDHADFSLTNLTDATPLIFGNPNLAPGNPWDVTQLAIDPTPALDQSDDDDMDGVVDADYLLDHSAILTARGLGRINAEGDSDLFVFVPPVDMLGAFEGKIDPEATGLIPWLAGHRPAPRVSISLQPAMSNPAAPAGGTDELIGPAPLDFLDGAITVYDSLGNIVYASANSPVFSLVSGHSGIDAGALDPSRWPAATDGSTDWIYTDYANTTTLQVWGGEPYYIEVSGTGSGRYTLNVSLDAMPDPNDTAFQIGPMGEIFDGFGWVTEASNGATLDLSGPLNTTPTQAAFLAARQVILGGLGRDGASTDDDNPSANLNDSTYYERAYLMGAATLVPNGGNAPFGLPFHVDPDLGDLTNVAGGGGIVVLQESGLAGIEHPLDTDLFFFTAPVSGTIEARINTTGLSDWFTELAFDSEDVEDPIPDNYYPEEIINQTLTKTYNSILDSALRIFNNDGIEIAYNNDNPALFGAVEGGVQIGSLGTRTFQRRDARVVFTVEQGETYFVQVESGQLENYYNYMQPGGRAMPVDWANLIGSYELLVNAVANPDNIGNDLPGSGPAAYATVIGTDESSSNLTLNNPRVIASTIGDSAVDPTDDDLFTFIAPANGTASITVGRDTGSSLNSRVTVLNDTGGVLDAVNSDGTGTAVATFAVQKGDRLFVVVEGLSGSEGDYVLTLGGISFTDDAPDLAHAADASSIVLNDFLSEETFSGEIEGTADTDVYRLSSPDFWDTFSVTVTSGDSLLDPAVEIWEMTVDPVGNTVLSLVAQNDNRNGGTTEAFTTFSLTPDRHTTVTGLTPSSDLELPDYYLVIRGSNPNGSFGEYDVTIGYTQTDDRPDDGEFAFATAETINPLTGLGVAAGEIEIASDSDVFSFVALAGGSASVSVSAGSSPLLPAITIVASDGMTVLDSDDTGGAAGNTTFDLVRGEVYYIIVEKSAFAAAGVSDTGTYSVTISVPPIDDHANVGEFDLATLLILDSLTGDGGLSSAFISPATRDSDLFRFTTIADGNVVITIDASLTGLPGKIAPSLRVFDASRTQIGSSSTAVVGGTVSFTINGATADQEYFILVADSIGLLTGEFSVAIDGPTPSMGGPGDIDFGNVMVVSDNFYNGDGTRSGSIDVAGERDLFSFTVPDPGDRTRMTRVFIQVRTPDGSLLDAAITVLNQPNETAIIAQDSAGIPGASAAAEVQVPAGQQLFIIVNDATLTNTGAYTIHIDAEPEKFYLYYPEGFASAAISEFLSIANANDYDVRYTVRVYYEISGGSATIVSNRLITAGTRGGVTMSDGQGGYRAGIIPDDPYAVVIESDGPLAATQARYDFGSAVGDSFTERVSDTWTFARIERDPGSVYDFVLWYNPNPFDVTVSFDVVLADSSTVTINRTVGGNERGGLNINNQLPLPLGVFGATVTAAASDGINDGDFRGIVAGLSHFDAVDQAGFGLLGDADGGATRGAITSLTRSAGVESEIAIFNPGASVANVVLTGKYIRNDFANLVRTFQINPGQTLRLTGAQLGLISGQPAGIEYSSDTPVSLMSAENQLGEANATAASSLAAQSWFYGDAFINSALAGDQYFETLNFYNPSAADTTVSVRLLFSNSDVVTINISVDAGGFAELLLHEAPEILNRADPLNFFSIEVSAATPIVASLTHYDLFLRGGWGNSGSNFGLLNPIEDII